MSGLPVNNPLGPLDQGVQVGLVVIGKVAGLLAALIPAPTQATTDMHKWD
jgi:hypothetical protein